MVDANGTTHSYGYDGVGRELSDSVTVASGNPYKIDTTGLQALRQAANRVGSRKRVKAENGSELNGT